ncbi:MAG: hypothetical protein GXX96_02190 [Planctomycetaceae bacterium]|nr:hypothetical protein [Planctomycetaceae bacterium]
MAVLGLVVVSVAVWFVAGWFRNEEVPADVADKTASLFLEDIRHDRVDAAWSGTTAEFKSFMGKDRLRQFVRTHSVLKEPTEFLEFQMISINGLPLAECTFRSSIGASTIHVLLANEAGQWKVERLLVD